MIHPSGDETKIAEGSYDPDQAERGVNCLVKSLQDTGIGVPSRGGVRGA